MLGLLITLFAMILPAADPAAVVKTSCLSCHSQSAKAGGFVLEGVTGDAPSSRPELWEKVVRKVSAGEMPPAGMPTPGPAVLKEFTAKLVKDLDDAARRQPYAGKPILQRLNRNEYSNAIRDILAIDLPLVSELPLDGVAAGFDNIGDALSISPLLLERYLRAARRVSDLATGVRESSTVTEVYPATASQAVWQEGMPFGTRGGIRVRHYFSHDGEYELRAFLGKESLTPTEGVRLFRTRIPMKAGSHNVIVTFPDEFAAREGPVSDVSGPGGPALGGPLDILGTAIRPRLDFRVDGRRAKLFEIAGMTSGEAAFDGQPGPPTVNRIEIAGPFQPSGVSDTPSKRRIFLCSPRAASEEPACATRIVSAIVRRAFRRDVTSTDCQPFLRTYAASRRQHSFEESIAAAIRDILIAPDFLFRLEIDPQRTSNNVYPISDFALASRLSFFLWSSIPDDLLLDKASAGKVRANLRSEIARMLADQRSDALADNFVSQWLGLRGLGEVEPDKEKFPEFDSALVSAFQSETRMFVRSVIRENRSILNLIGADYTYLNERLASLYGIEGVTGPAFRRVQLPAGAQRGGLLGQGSVLMLTSHAARTSPVLRGKWILNNLLNSPPPPPPANVPPLDEGPASGRKLTTREQVERHRQNPACASCHARIDGFGFALENFDVLGRWRTKDDGGEIDATGKLANGKAFTGPLGLKNFLLHDSDEFVRGTVEKLMTYALGRELDARDQPAVREVIRATQTNGYRFGELIEAVANSVPFQMRQAQEQ